MTSDDRHEDDRPTDRPTNDRPTNVSPTRRPNTSQTRRAFLANATAIVVGATGVAGARTRRHPENVTLQQDETIPARFPSAREIDVENGTVTLPLYRGQTPDGEALYVLFESATLRQATRRGVNWSPKLANALDTDAVDRVSGRQPLARNRESAGIAFRATPNFALDRNLVPGPEGFPLGEGTNPGARSDRYTPLVTTRRGNVYNAPHVANSTGEHDSVVSIDRDAMEVTMALTAGFYEGQRVLYVSTDASAPEVATLEAATYVPSLNAAPAAGDRNTATSAREPIIPVVNGPMGADNPERQGLRSAVAGEGSPLNVVAEEQTCGDPSFRADCDALFYSPLWDVHPVAWTQAAIDAGQRRRLRSHQDAITAFRQGQLTTAAPNGPVNEQLGDMRAAGALVNCPLILVEGGG